MEAMAFTGLLRFLQPMIGSKKPELKKITEQELENIREQRRLVINAAKVHKMLTVSFNLTMTNLATKYDLPKDSSIDFETGEMIDG